eukprot:CAMPEP_0206202104 /NCGR_PEP_ID=MMETSP0166-20121206/11961_1 /ASSEMBLY_ACC=CAM_ASM_000260 /TAXON_ID=95228 /ORGANISM="Vannella robusta, Strain DIVA3 518/3/11/1/6" /LENGTH=78 /DNA_ID=CAMNT_0053620939 /DNA_START=408 /DNA_END=641 /DNA_ORIENTATION=+
MPIVGESYTRMVSQPWTGTLSKEKLYLRNHTYDFDSIQARPVSISVKVDPNLFPFLTNGIQAQLEGISDSRPFGAVEV